MVAGNALIVAIIAAPVTIAVGYLTDGGDSMYRRKLAMVFWAIGSGCGYLIAALIPLVEDFNMQWNLWRVAAVFWGFGAGFWAAPSASLAMSCLANQDETSTAKTLRSPAGVLGSLIGSCCIGVVLSLFETEEQGVYSYWGYLIMCGFGIFWPILGVSMAHSIRRKYTRVSHIAQDEGAIEVQNQIDIANSIAKLERG